MQWPKFLLRVMARLNRRWRPFAVGAALLLLLASLVHDIVTQLRTSPAVVSVKHVGPSNAPYRATANLQVKSFDRQRRTATADLQVTVTGRGTYRDVRDRIEMIIVMFEAGDSRIPLRARSPFTEELRLESSQVPTAHIRQKFENVSFPIEALPELFYPFDGATLRIAPDGCANQIDCPGGGGLLFDDVTVALADSTWRTENFVLSVARSAGTLSVRTRRHSFLRVITAYLVLVFAVFIVYLLRLKRAGDLLPESLGLLGGLWGFRELVMPNDVGIFPSLVDYAVLAAFGGVFLVLVSRVQERRA